MKKRNPTAQAEVSHACYLACKRAGVLRNGRPLRSGLRSGQRFRDERKEGNRRACRGKEQTDG